MRVDIDAFQDRVSEWMVKCFGVDISNDKLERGDRLLEEILELLQSGEYPPERVAALTKYVWSRPIGEPSQEVGGVMVTLAAYCGAHNLDIANSAETELQRVWGKIDQIRAKQAAKPTGSALPISAEALTVPPDAEGVVRSAQALLDLNASGAAVPRIPTLAVNIITDLITALRTGRAAQPAEPVAEDFGPAIIVDYTNWRGEKARRSIRPGKLWWGQTEWHPHDQWLMTAWDCEKEAVRDFSLQDMQIIPNPATAHPAPTIKTPALPPSLAQVLAKRFACGIEDLRETASYLKASGKVSKNSRTAGRMMFASEVLEAILQASEPDPKLHLNDDLVERARAIAAAPFAYSSEVISSIIKELIA